MADRLAIVKLQPGTVLDWWSFSGAGSEHLARAYPQAKRWQVEPTSALAARSSASERSPWWAPWRRASAELIEPAQLDAGSVQLIWSNMSLHAAHDPAAWLAQWHRALAVDGFVMFSCLGPGSLRQLRDLYRRERWAAPMAELVDMHDLGDMLVHAGFADPVMDQEVLRLTWASPEALLAELREWGANAAPDRFAGLRTPRWQARLREALQALAGADGRIALDVEVAYGHAFKAAPRVRVQPETAVSLDEMRQLVRTRAPRA